MGWEKSESIRICILLKSTISNPPSNTSSLMNTKINSYKDLFVWQKAIDLVVHIYQLTGTFPKSELFCLTSQMRRAAVSIASNIAEGRARGTRKDYRQFIIIAFGSGAELETQLIIARRLSLGDDLKLREIDTLLEQVMKMLNKLPTLTVFKNS